MPPNTIKREFQAEKKMVNSNEIKRVIRLRVISKRIVYLLKKTLIQR